MVTRALLAVRVGTIVALLTFLVLMLEVNAKPIWGGKRLKGDKLVYVSNNETFIVRQKSKVCYPTSRSPPVNITMYVVKDLMPKGRGVGVPSLYKVNQTSICFLLRSKQAYNFTISLWGFRIRCCDHRSTKSCPPKALPCRSGTRYPTTAANRSLPLPTWKQQQPIYGPIYNPSYRREPWPGQPRQAPAHRSAQTRSAVLTDYIYLTMLSLTLGIIF